MYPFQFRGGSQKSGDQIRFYLFGLFDGKEVMMYDAVNRGLIRRGDLDNFYSVSPYLKVFTSTATLGKSRYYNFFFHLGETSPEQVTIRNLGWRPGQATEYYFTARGRFLKDDEIRSTYSEETIKYYSKQPYLARAELQELIQINRVDVAGASVKLRKIWI